MASRESTVVSKLPWDLLPMDAVEEIVKVLEKGAVKYSPNNWRAAPHFKPSQIVASAMRHLVARYWHGELYDKETGLLHTAHAACNMIFAIYYDRYNLYSTEPDTIVVSGEVGQIVAEGRIEKFEVKAEDVVNAEDMLAIIEAHQESPKTPLQIAQEIFEKRKKVLGIQVVPSTYPHMNPPTSGTRSVSEMARLNEEEGEE